MSDERDVHPNRLGSRQEAMKWQRSYQARWETDHRYRGSRYRTSYPDAEFTIFSRHNMDTPNDGNIPDEQRLGRPLRERAVLPQFHAGARRACHQRAAVVSDIALDVAQGAPRLDNPCLGG
jgi:hypothetical protein